MAQDDSVSLRCSKLVCEIIGCRRFNVSSLSLEDWQKKHIENTMAFSLSNRLEQLEETWLLWEACSLKNPKSKRSRGYQTLVYSHLVEVASRLKTSGWLFSIHEEVLGLV